MSTDPVPSDALRSALTEYARFLESDDVDRETDLAAAGPEVLEGLVLTVRPLFGEINELLDRLAATPHPLPDDLADLEDNLNSLAQAAMEAEADIV